MYSVYLPIYILHMYLIYNTHIYDILNHTHNYSHNTYLTFLGGVPFLAGD